uniref:Protein TIC 214 n=1 Tax=Gastoniella chaerophylla TaxID=170708 RepID=A0A3G5CSA6_9MONI|nr:conserved hypothetical chloroplast protein Ycf1 [Gastoniella chaerophylla]AYW15688.1 conserved hypothetical chloroplast protein Ycf1 [Gastoniella chaerophylla]
MNTNIFLILTWMKLMSPYMLFGLYYGLLTTLPMGPSQILCVRSFLLGGNLSGIISLSGSMLAQLITILAIYYSPIYSLLLKPHLLTIVAVPYTFLFCLVIKDFPNYDTLRPVTKFKDSRVVRLFLMSFLFQIFNPILLPNPVLTRLTYLVFFRYSNNKIFLFAALWGWLIGQAAFNFLSKLLLTRVKRDSPMLYLLAKRSIYTTFSIVSVIQAVTHLGRAPVSFWTKKFMNESQDKETAFWEIAEYPDLSWWFFKPWPISFFDPSRGNRGNRFVKNCRSDTTSSFYKGRTSTYFFTKCLSDGKERLSLAALPSLSIFEKYMYRYMSKSPRSIRDNFFSQNWVSEKLIQAQLFQKELTGRVKILDTGSSFSKAIGKRTRLIGGRKYKIPFNYDPFANNFRIRIPVPQTFMTVEDLSLTNWEWDNLQTTKRSKGKIGIARKNVLKDWISTENRKGKNRGFENSLPWETLSRRSRRIFHFIFKKRVFYDYDVQKILEKVKSLSGTDVTWEEIINLDFEDRALFLTYLKEEKNCCQSNQISFFKGVLFYNYEKKKPLTAGKRICKLHEIEDLTMDLARNLAIYFENDFDGPGGDTDFRYRKLRNVGITSPRGKPRWAKLVKRYARISDFRRKFLKGSMRSRRRKTLLWKALQEKIRSAFFLRSMEIPILFKLPINQLKTLSPRTRFGEVKKDVNYGFEEQILEIYPLTKESLTDESRLARSAIAARTDIGPIHNGRGYMLVFQSRFRKFIKLPALIVMKSFVRILLRQESEWKKDWIKWKKEIHINCTFDGEEFSQDDLPPRWLREGIQIKILYPMCLKPWQTNRNKKQLTLRNEYMETGLSGNPERKSKKNLKYNKPKFTYLTVLGYQTDIPFGTIQKESSFWKPVQKNLIRTCRKVLPRRIKHVYQNINLNFGKVLRLRLTVLKMKGFNFPSKVTPKVEMPSYFSSNRNYWMKSLDSINEMGKSNSNIFKEIDKSIAIGGEIHSATNLSKKVVAQDPVKEKSVAGNVPINTVKLLDKKIKENRLNSEEILVDPVSIEPILDSKISANLERFKQNQPIGSDEIVVNLRSFLAESFEEFVWTLINLFFIIDRVLSQSFHESLVLHKELVRLLNKIDSKKTSSTKNNLSRFGSSSQACLYVDLWNVGVEKNLDLSLLTFDQKENNTVCRKNTWNSYTDVASKPPSTRRAIASTTTKYSNLVERGNCVKDLVSPFDKKTDNKFFGEQIAKCLKKWGFSKKLHNLDEKTWNNWLDCFYKYNLPSPVWHEIAPQKWKFSLKRFGIGRNIANKLKGNISQSKVHNYSIYAKRYFLINRLTNFNRIQKHRSLLQNLTDFVRHGDIQTCSVQQNIFAQRFRCKDRIRRVGEFVGKHKIEKIYNFDGKLRYNLKLDLMLWLDPNVRKRKSFLQSKNKPKRSQNPLFKDSDQYHLILDINRRFQKVSNELYEILLDEREDADFIFRWKWRFETELDRFKNLIVLTRMLENDQDLVTLCANTEIDLDLLNFRLNATTRVGLLQTLSLISAHRLPLVFDDQNLLYKIINPVLKLKSRSKNRANKRLYKKIYSDNYVSKVFHLVTERNCKQSTIYNIDDLLLLRRRRQFRFLRCLLTSKKSHTWEYYNQIISDVQRDQTSKRQYSLHLSRLSEIQKIKRFLWPSHRLEELACTGRFCLGALTESRFTALKFRMYPNIPSQNKQEKKHLVY